MNTNTAGYSPPSLKKGINNPHDRWFARGQIRHGMQPMRVVALVILVAIAAAIFPVRIQSISIMTPFYRALPGVYGSR